MAGNGINSARAGSKGSSPSAPRDWRHLSSLFEQLPPHAIEAEMSLLGSMLLDPQVVGDVIQVVRSADDFYKPANGAIFGAMVKLYDEQSQLDLVQLHQLLVDRSILEEVGGQSYLVELAEAVPSASNATYYAKLVREKAMIRQLIAAAGDILYNAYHSPDDARAILDEAEQRIFHIAEQSWHVEVETLHDLIKQTMAMLEANAGQQMIGLPTGFAELNEMTGGLQRGELIIIAARPSMGKTALALNMAEHMAMSGRGVGIFSLEMSKQQLVQRLLCARSGLDSHRVRRSMLVDSEWRQLMRACDEFLDAPLFIDDTPGLTLLQLRAKARRMVGKYDAKAIFIDYLQLLGMDGRIESRQIEVSTISRGLKAMARELNVPVVCLSQLNRSPEQREGHRPRMSDLRESGSIEQDADVVAMLHREDYYHQGEDGWAESNPDKVNIAELIITKQRNGPTGSVRMTWLSQSTRFCDYSPARPPAEYEHKPPHGRAAGAGGMSASGAAPFGRSSRTGPVENFRDGGGPERDAGGADDVDLADDLPI
jgi:replicative DNA helicase